MMGKPPKHHGAFSNMHDDNDDDILGLLDAKERPKGTHGVGGSRASDGGPGTAQMRSIEDAHSYDVHNEEDSDTGLKTDEEEDDDDDDGGSLYMPRGVTKTVDPSKAKKKVIANKDSTNLKVGL
jgi:hypothetical protein